MKKWFYLLILIPIVAHLLNLFVLHHRERFYPREFTHGFKPSYAVEVSDLDYTPLDPIFSQPFHYLGHGRQMIAFESRDGKYVLKLFNPMRPLKKQWYKKWRYWKRYSSLRWVKREWFSKRRRLKILFKRHKIAYEHLKKETGLVFVHLNTDRQICHLVHLTDSRSKLHILNLFNTPFVLQEKAILVPTYLNGLIEADKWNEAIGAINEIEHLFNRRIEEGITDRIQTMENNYGFANGHPIQIDVGKIEQHDHLPPGEKERVLSNFKGWLSVNFPNLTRLRRAAT